MTDVDVTGRIRDRLRALRARREVCIERLAEILYRDALEIIGCTDDAVGDESRAKAQASARRIANTTEGRAPHEFWQEEQAICIGLDILTDEIIHASGALEEVRSSARAGIRSYFG